LTAGLGNASFVRMASLFRSGRLVRLAGLVLALAGAWSIANAQDLADIPPDALVPNEQAREVFATLGILAREGRELPPWPPESAAPADAIIERLYARGTQLPNWSRLGVDLGAAIAEREGGVRGNMLVSDGPFGPGRAYALDEPFEAVVPPEWQLIWSHGSVAPGEATMTSIQAASPKVRIVERTFLRRQGRAACREKSETRIYALPDVAAAEMDTIAFFMTVRMLTTLDQRPLVCSVTMEIEPGVYRDHNFDVEGYHLPAFDVDMPLARIVRRESSNASSNWYGLNTDQSFRQQ
jgi:hypothetical protein